MSSVLMRATSRFVFRAEKFSTTGVSITQFKCFLELGCLAVSFSIHHEQCCVSINNYCNCVWGGVGCFKQQG